MSKAASTELLSNELTEMVQYIDCGVCKLKDYNDHGLALHYLNTLSIRMGLLLGQLNESKNHEQKQRETFLKQQLNLDLAEAQDDDGNSGHPEQ